MSFLCCSVWPRGNLEPPLLPLKPVAVHELVSPFLQKVPVHSWVRHLTSWCEPKKKKERGKRRKFTKRKISLFTTALAASWWFCWFTCNFHINIGICTHCGEGVGVLGMEGATFGVFPNFLNMGSLFKGWGLFYLASLNPWGARLYSCSCTWSCWRLKPSQLPINQWLLILWKHLHIHSSSPHLKLSCRGR